MPDQKALIQAIPIPNAVIQRFSHLRDKLVKKVVEDVEFLYLCDDYSSVVRSLNLPENKGSAQREEVTILKGELELEILERLSRSSAPD